MYRVTLTEEQQEALRRRCRDPKTQPRTRDRLEMVRLSDAGWSIPKIAEHLGISEARTRHWIKTFLSGGFDALPDQPHVGQTSSLTLNIVEAVKAELRKGGRTWTAGQIADWVEEAFGLRLSGDHLGRQLNRAGIVWKRTSRSVKHKQKPEEVEAKRTELRALEKGARPERSICATSTKPGSP
jgi:transposase